MTSTILIPGFTQDDKVPGSVTKLSYGVGRRSAGNLPVKVRLCGAMRQAQEAANTAVTKSSSGPAITLSGTPLLDGEYVLTITTAGANGTAQFGVTRNGESVASGVTVPTTPFTYVIPGGSGITVTFGNGTHVLNETHSWTSAAAATYGTASYAVLYDIFTEEEADDRFGAGSELALMCRAALAIPGVSVQAIAVAPAGGAVRASLTIAFGGSVGSGGDPAIRLAKKTYRVSAGSTDTVAAVVARFEDAINDDPQAFCTADADGTDLILTVKSAGTRGNFWSAWVDLSEGPSTLTATITGGATLTGGGKYFASGSGVDDVTNALATLLPVRAPLYDFLAFAQSDAVNAALVEAQIHAKAGWDVKQYEQVTFAVNGTAAAAMSLASATMNYPLLGLLHMEESEQHPAVLAAQFAALRSVTEGQNPNTRYNGQVLPSGVGRAPDALAKEPGRSTLKALLNSGVTPLITVDGEVQVVRAITTKCLTGGTPDYRTLDLGQATVPMRASREVDALWTSYAAENPYAGPDPDLEGNEAVEPSGVATPRQWKSQLLTLLSTMERNLWIHEVSDNEPLVEWDIEARRIMSAVPIAVRPQNHQLGTDIRQVA